MLNIENSVILDMSVVGASENDLLINFNRDGCVNLFFNSSVLNIYPVM